MFLRKIIDWNKIWLSWLTSKWKWFILYTIFHSGHWLLASRFKLVVHAYVYHRFRNNPSSSIREPFLNGGPPTVSFSTWCSDLLSKIMAASKSKMKSPHIGAFSYQNLCSRVCFTKGWNWYRSSSSLHIIVKYQWRIERLLLTIKSPQRMRNKQRSKNRSCATTH